MSYAQYYMEKYENLYNKSEQSISRRTKPCKKWIDDVILCACSDKMLNFVTK